MALRDFRNASDHLDNVIKSKAKLWQVGMDRVSANAAEFSRQLSQLSDIAESAYEALVKTTCLNLFLKIALRNPADTGRSRAAWGIDFSNKGDVPPEDFGEHSDNKGQIAENVKSPKADSIIKAKWEQFSYTIDQDRVVIYNNVEYIERLEDGTSRQAPAGMVAVSLAEFNANLAENIANLGL